MWPDYYPFSKGECQSPIELHTRYIKHDGSLRPWNHSYHPSSSLTIVNDGTTVKVVFDDSSDKSGDYFHYDLLAFISCSGPFLP